MDLTDPTTFARAYDHHGRAVYSAAMRILGDPARAQDVTQDVFLRVWRNPGRFDERRGELGSYLRLMAGDEVVRTDDRPSVIAERDEDRAVVRAALARLPEAQREALVLAYFGELTADEIARRSGVPLGTAKSRIRLGLTKLRAEIAGVLADEPAPALAVAA